MFPVLHRTHRTFAVVDRHGDAAPPFGRFSAPCRLEPGGGRVGTTVVGPSEGLEGVLDAGLRESWPVILDGQDQVPVPIAGGNEHSPSGGVCLTAFSTRLASAWRIHTGSTLTEPSPARNCTCARSPSAARFQRRVSSSRSASKISSRSTPSTPARALASTS